MIAYIAKIFGKTKSDLGLCWIKIPTNQEGIYQLRPVKSIFEEDDLAEGTAVMVEKNDDGELEITGIINGWRDE